MVRSSGIPRSVGLKHIRTIVAQRQTPIEITSITYTTSELDETVETETDHTESIWLYQGTSRLVQELIGERQVGTLSGIATTPIDIEIDDRLTYNGIEYDVVDKIEYPEENSDFVIIGCAERQG